MKVRYAIVAFFVVSCFSALSAFAQDPPDISAGMSPSETYFGGDFESVDMATGMLKLHIPLLTDRSQRGNLNFTYGLNASGWGSWFVYCSSICYYAPGNQSASPGPVPVMEGAITGPSPNVYTGENTGVEPDSSWHYLFAPTTSATYNESYDGSGIQAATTCSLGSSCIANSNAVQFVNNVMGATSNAFIEDTNGNQISMTSSGGTYNAIFGTDQSNYDSQFGIGNAWTMTDTLGRTWSFAAASDTTGCPYAVGASSAAIWTTPPVGGTTTRQFEFCYSNVSVETSLPASSGTYQYVGSIPAVTAVVLPDGTSWQFQYNDSYGDITGIVLPTGGTISYTYSISGTSSVVNSRTVFDGTSSHTWYFSWNPNVMTDPLGNDTVYAGSPISSIKYYAGSHLGGTLLKTIGKAYVTLGGWCADLGYVSSPIPSADTTTWGISGQSVQAATTYDSGFSWTCTDGSGGSVAGVYGLAVQQTQSDFYTTTPTALWKKNTTYVALSNSSYLSGPNLLGLVQQQKLTDNNGNVCSETDYTYDDSVDSYPGSLIQHTTAPFSVRGNLTTVTRQLFSTPCSSTTPSKTPLTTTQHMYDTGMLHSFTDPLSNPTTYAYASTYYGAYPTTVTNAKSQNTTYAYDFNSGTVTSITDPNGPGPSGHGKTYSYDCMLRPEEIDYPDGGQQTVTYIYGTASYGCSGSGNPYTGATYNTKITSSLTHSVTTTFDGVGRTIQTKSSVPSTTCSSLFAYVNKSYDADGRLSSVSNADCTGHSSDNVNTTYTYDPLNRVTQTTEQDGSIVSTSYLNNCTAVTDEVGKARKSCADGAGRMTGVWEDPFGVDFETDYSYNPMGSLLQVEQKGGDSNSADWRTRTFSYDSLSRQVCAADPEVYSAASCPGSTTGAVQYAYDGDNNLTSKTAPKEDQSYESSTVTTTYAYDVLNRLVQKSYDDSTTPTVKYVYDGDSLPSGCSLGSFSYGSYPKTRRTAMCDTAGSEAWQYDSMGRPLIDKRITNTVTNSTTYSYNYDGTLFTLTYPSGRMITYGINVAEQPTSAQDTANSINYATTALYTPFGALSSLTNGSGSTILTSLYYNSRLQPCRIAVNSSGTAPGACIDSYTGNVMDLTYNFNAGIADNGDPTAIVNNLDNTRSQVFTYDPLNRLATAAASTYAISAAHCWGEAFGYDAWANLLSIGPISSAYNYCTQEQPNFSIGSNNHITNSGFSYDAAGELTAESSTGPFFTYNAEGQMTQAASLATAGYVYDGEGRRVEKTATGSAYELYWYDSGGNVLDESDGSGNLLNEYVFFDGKLIARRKVQ